MCRDHTRIAGPSPSPAGQPMRSQVLSAPERSCRQFLFLGSPCRGGSRSASPGGLLDCFPHLRAALSLISVKGPLQGAPSVPERVIRTGVERAHECSGPVFEKHQKELLFNDPWARRGTPGCPEKPGCIRWASSAPLPRTVVRRCEWASAMSRSASRIIPSPFSSSAPAKPGEWHWEQILDHPRPQTLPVLLSGTEDVGRPQDLHSGSRRPRGVQHAKPPGGWPVRSAAHFVSSGMGSRTPR